MRRPDSRFRGGALLRQYGCDRSGWWLRRDSDRWRARIATVLGDRLTLSLALVFVIGAAFYLWTAANTGNVSLAQSYAAGHVRSDTTFPFSLAGGQTDPYNELAKAFLHLHLSVGTVPAGQVYGPGSYQYAPWYRDYADLVLYHGRFYLTWGPHPRLCCSFRCTCSALLHPPRLLLRHG